LSSLVVGGYALARWRCLPLCQDTGGRRLDPGFRPLPELRLQSGTPSLS
jgi:hypothetical protein